ncbi:hypothetical protein F4810DRAFT_726684 [Camillea tinctor]|nr:hypothetical protein F4810DRAFT_726684 [Camillea tinctor]
MSAKQNVPQVPFEYLTIPRYTEKSIKQMDDPYAKAWMVKRADDIYQTGGFVKGQAIRDIAVDIHTLAGQDRPKILYRVVHDGQPHYGMKARGYGIVQVDPPYFQTLVQKHMRWQSRFPSPFMSVTDDWEMVKCICKTYQQRGDTGIKVITFKSSGPGRDHTKQQLWDCKQLGARLKLGFINVKKFFEYDYLPEGYILEEAIIKT